MNPDNNDNLINNTFAHLLPCAEDIPRTSEFYKDLPNWAKGVLIFHGVVCLACVLIFLEILVFLLRHFKDENRLNGTIWTLALYPVFSVTSVISLLVPSSGTLINFVSNVYLGSALYRLMGLMENYLGGSNTIVKHFLQKRDVKINTLPVCCCCFCLPTMKLSRKTYSTLRCMVVQVAVIRPCAMFVAAVLWTNHDYIPGSTDPRNAFVYIAVVMLVSTMLAMWGLVVIKNAFAPELEVRYKMTGKLISVQLLLLSTALVNILCGVLVTSGVIGCTPLLPSAARADALFHQILNILACLLIIMARFFYRRLEDAALDYDPVANHGAEKRVTAA